MPSVAVHIVGLLFALTSLGVALAPPACLAVVVATVVALLAAGWRRDGDPRVVLEGLRGLELRGRARLCRDVAARALEGGEDAGEVARKLRGVELEGRAGLCLGVARRCLEGAGRCGRLEARLRKEATGWLRETIKELMK